MPAGDIAFIGFNTDGNSDFAIVVLEAIDGFTSPVEIKFTDNEWNGTAFNSDEAVMTWTINSLIPAGTVVAFNNLRSIPTVTAGTVSISGNMALQNNDEVLYAFTGTLATPDTFLAAIARSTFSRAVASLSGTGLALGSTALELKDASFNNVNNINFAEYIGIREGTKTDLLSAINTISSASSTDWYFAPITSGDDSRPFNVTLFTECFLEGTRILSDRGEIPVEWLKIGDRILTATGQPEPIKWIGHQTIVPNQVSNPLRSYPILIKAGALGDHLPHRDLYVSPDHALLVDGLLINAGALVNDLSILRTVPTAPFTYYHVELHQHATLVAEGATAESYLPQREDRFWYDNGSEYQGLYPHDGLLAYWPMPYPRISSQRQLPRFILKRLRQVAETLVSQGLVA
ncbi:MAG: Hint domain-containing protein [Leptolyngbyaceae bacterium]|nr:Hint domain-containing protein [Leptolyngbyaceae bacterium]